MSENEVFTKPLSPAPDAFGRQSASRRVRLVGYAVGAIITIGLMALAVWIVSVARDTSTVTDSAQPEAATAPAQWQRPVVSSAGLADRSGVRITQLAISGGGGLIDLRYEVLDPDKAAVLHAEATPPVLVDDTSGVVVDQLLMGHSHSGSFTAGQTYYMIFENPGNLVQRGSTVSVLLGNAEVDHVPVQ